MVPGGEAGGFLGMEDTFPCGGSLQPVVEGIPRTKLSSGSSLHSVGVRDNSVTRGLGV